MGGASYGSGVAYEGVGFEGRICGVSILRAGEVCVEMPTTYPILTLSIGYGSWPAGGVPKRTDRQDSNSKGEPTFLIVHWNLTHSPERTRKRRRLNCSTPRFASQRKFFSLSVVIICMTSFRQILHPDMSSFLTPCWVSNLSFQGGALTPVSEANIHLATGGSAIKAVEVLKEHNVPENRIIFINLVCYPLHSALLN